ncbi:hypothetical protein PHMEG_00035380 [Phytophthora megakarya]|uniref:Uncharacterized protein n=1 Tax=Phytophthora megakarya TaxID=4795 RepID=A0A225UPA3_9STRA|nr:hypothetical protein PHMEG_00035380 [Phytophthora megakarya]
MTYKEAREAWKWADNFGLSSDNVLYYTARDVVEARGANHNDPRGVMTPSKEGTKVPFALTKE